MHYEKQGSISFSHFSVDYFCISRAGSKITVSLVSRSYVEDLYCGIPMSKVTWLLRDHLTAISY